MYITAAVLLGNLISFVFAWGLYGTRGKSDEEIPWICYAAMGMPLVFLMLAMTATVGPPPFLSALGAQ